MELNDFKPGDRVRVTTRLGPNGGREGTVSKSQHIPSGTVTIELDGDDNFFTYFLPDQLEVFDPAPVPPTEPKAPSLNRLLEQLEADCMRMLDVSTDVQTYGMRGLSKALGEEAETLGQFVAQLKWALRKDGLLEEKENDE